MSNGMSTREQVRAAVMIACRNGGCPDLASEIVVTADLDILRPPRRLKDREAFAMCRAWFDGYQAAGVRVCPTRQDLLEPCDGCEVDCVPNYDDEFVVLRTLPDLKRKLTTL